MSGELPADPQQPELLRVCRIGRAQGLKGEVTVRIFTDEPEERFAPGAELFNRDGSVTYIVERARTFKNRWYLKLEGVDDRNAAEELNGTVLYGEPWELEDDEFYPKDIVGLEARLKADGTHVDVYSSDGIMIRHNVIVSEALNDLPEGIYIIGNQKVVKK